MAVSTMYALHGILNSSTFISQISNAQVSSGLEYYIAQAAGMPYSQFVATMAANPGVTFDTPQLKTVLDLSGAMTGIASLAAANTDLHFKKISDLGRRVADATAEHLRFRMAQAWLGVESITAGHRSVASASVRLGTTYDGSNVPLVPAGTLALAGTPTAALHYVSGPVYLNTVALPGVQDITIDFGRNYIEAGGEGELYNTFAALGSYNPVITIRCTEHKWDTYGLAGTALTAGSFYLRKLATTGRVADGTAEHIKFAATAGLITVDDSSGGNSDPSITTYRVTLVGSSSTVEPITVDTAVAITT
jgi:hypothetical protein